MRYSVKTILIRFLNGSEDSWSSTRNKSEKFRMVEGIFKVHFSNLSRVKEAKALVREAN